ncbi:MAG: hypothetical protein JSU69_11450, partial [Candidatus Zixiibacteriota bacterium]
MIKRHLMIDNLKRSVIWIGIAVLMIAAAPALSDDDNGFLGQSGEFLRYGASVRSLGIGGAYTSMAGDISSIYYNPAGITRLAYEHEIYVMHSWLFEESRYNFAAAALPRLKIPRQGIWRYFPGSYLHSGVGFVDLTSQDFERRDVTDDYQGDFSVYHRALFVSLASEMVKPWGILSYGSTFKGVYQGVGDLSAAGFGLDVGCQFQLLSPTSSTRFPLRILIPLRMGLSFQNLIRPNVKLASKADKYPQRIRLGFSGGYKVRNNARLSSLFDLEYMPKANAARRFRFYGGVEFEWAVEEFRFSPRIGFNNLDKSFNAGLGLSTDIIYGDIKFDFALGDQNFPGSDYRFSITFDFGDLLDGCHFRHRGDTIKIESARENYLQTVSRYQGDIDECIESVADSLGTVYDASNARRYWDLIGGVKKANEIYNDGIRLLIESNPHISPQALEKFREALKEYRKAVKKDFSKFKDNDILNFGETLMMLGLWASAKDTIQLVDESGLRKHYQLGVCFLMLNSTESAKDQFEPAHRQPENNRSMRLLSHYALGWCYMQLGEYARCTTTVYSIVDGRAPSTSRFDAPLLDYYPRFGLAKDTARYVPICDGNVADDAQFLIGECLEKWADSDSS